MVALSGVIVAALFAWLYAAYRDIQSRHVPNHLWIVLLLLALLRALSGTVPLWRFFTVGIGCIIAGAIIHYKVDFAPGDAKALMVSGFLYPDLIFVFLFGLLIGILSLYGREESPAIEAFALGAICATVVYLL